MALVDPVADSSSLTSCCPVCECGHVMHINVAFLILLCILAAIGALACLFMIIEALSE